MSRRPEMLILKRVTKRDWCENIPNSTFVASAFSLLGCFSWCVDQSKLGFSIYNLVVLLLHCKLLEVVQMIRSHFEMTLEIIPGFGLPNFAQKNQQFFGYYPLKKTTKTQLKKTQLINQRTPWKKEEYFSQEIHHVHVWFALHFIPGYIWLPPGFKWHFKQLNLKRMNM
jgi:hypothetical protein